MRAIINNATFSDEIKKLVKRFGIGQDHVQPRGELTPEQQEKNKDDVIRDLGRTYTRYNQNNNPDTDASAWEETSAKHNIFSQGDMEGGAPINLLALSLAYEKWVFSPTALRLFYRNNKMERCGLTLNLIMEGPSDPNKPAEPLEWIMSNLTEPRYGDEDETGYHSSLFASETFFGKGVKSRASEHSRTTLDEISDIIGSEKVASWVRFILNMKTTSQFASAIKLYECLQFSVSPPEPMTKDKEFTPSYVFDIPALNSTIIELATKEHNLLAKVNTHVLSVRHGWPIRAALFLACLIAKTKNEGLRTLCANRLEQMATSPDINNKEICAGAKEIINASSQGERIISVDDFMAIQKRLGYRSLEPTRQAVISILGNLIKIVESGNYNKDALYGLNETKEKLTSEKAWSAYAMSLSAALQNDNPLPIQGSLELEKQDQEKFNACRYFKTKEKDGAANGDQKRWWGSFR